MKMKEWVEASHKVITEEVDKILTVNNLKVNKKSFSIGYMAGLLNMFELTREYAAEKNFVLDEDSFQLGLSFGEPIGEKLRTEKENIKNEQKR
jgi:hypothetical protein